MGRRHLPLAGTQPVKPRVLVLAGNSGLGSGLIEALLLQARFEVFATYRGDPEALRARYSGHGLDPDHHVIHADLTSYTEAGAAMRAVAEGGPLWGVVNLAGKSSARRLARMDADEARAIFLDNALPALFVTKSALEVLPENGLQGGRIVHVSSVTVRRPVPGTVPYVAGKAAVEGIVRAAAEEGGRHGITVNALRLGYFEAGMTAGVPDAILATVVSATPAGRLGSLADLTHAVSTLLSEESSFLNGAVFDVDGGLT